MHAQCGSCPHCGAPIYLESPWWGITPPPPVYSCACRLMVHSIMAGCQHCFCHQDTGGTRCCKCGQAAHMPPSSFICSTTMSAVPTL